MAPQWRLDYLYDSRVQHGTGGQPAAAHAAYRRREASCPHTRNAFMGTRVKIIRHTSACFQKNIVSLQGITAARRQRLKPQADGAAGARRITSHQCGNKKHHQQRYKNIASAGIRRSYFVLDVPRLRLPQHRRHIDARHGLDVDVAVVSFRHTGADVPRLALEADPRADRRTPEAQYIGQLRVPFIRGQPRNTAHRRVHKVRSAQEIRRGVVRKGPWHSGHRACHRHAADGCGDGADAALADECIFNVLQQDGHKPRFGNEPLLRHGIPRHGGVRHRGTIPAAHTAEEAIDIQ